ncbi:MAG: hypothetical protein MI747_04635, partial [Desulfobacterales bacterium]|nr:hypothetical protein [Desulfobacterales bacterium]
MENLQTATLIDLSSNDDAMDTVFLKYLTLDGLNIYGFTPAYTEIEDGNLFIANGRYFGPDGGQRQVQWVRLDEYYQNGAVQIRTKDGYVVQIDTDRYLDDGYNEDDNWTALQIRSHEITGMFLEKRGSADFDSRNHQARVGNFTNMQAPYYPSILIDTNVINIFGDHRNNVIHGNEKDNTILGGGGNDYIYGHGGNDTIIVQDNDEGYPYATLDGGAGDDIIKGGGNINTIRTGTGRDTVYVSEYSSSTRLELTNEEGVVDRVILPFKYEGSSVSQYFFFGYEYLDIYGELFGETIQAKVFDWGNTAQPDQVEFHFADGHIVTYDEDGNPTLVGFDGNLIQYPWKDMEMDPDDSNTGFNVEVYLPFSQSEWNQYGGYYNIPHRQRLLIPHVDADAEKRITTFNLKAGTDTVYETYTPSSGGGGAWYEDWFDDPLSDLILPDEVQDWLNDGFGFGGEDDLEDGESVRVKTEGTAATLDDFLGISSLGSDLEVNDVEVIRFTGNLWLEEGKHTFHYESAGKAYLFINDVIQNYPAMVPQNEGNRREFWNYFTVEKAGFYEVSLDYVPTSDEWINGDGDPFAEDQDTHYLTLEWAKPGQHLEAVDIGGDNRQVSVLDLGELDDRSMVRDVYSSQTGALLYSAVNFNGQDEGYENVKQILGTKYKDTLKGNDQDNFFAGNGGKDFLQGRGGSDFYQIAPEHYTRINNYDADQTGDIVYIDDGVDDIFASVDYNYNLNIYQQASVVARVEWWGISESYRHLKVQTKDGFVSEIQVPSVTEPNYSYTNLDGEVVHTYRYRSVGTRLVKVHYDPNDNSGFSYDMDDVESLVSIQGGDGADTITGNDLDNLIVGGGGADDLSGGEGNDTFIVDPTDEDNAVNLRGGMGQDSYVINLGPGSVIIDNTDDDDATDILRVHTNLTNLGYFIDSTTGSFHLRSYYAHADMLDVEILNWATDEDSHDLLVVTDDDWVISIDQVGTITDFQRNYASEDQGVEVDLSDQLFTVKEILGSNYADVIYGNDE